ncbi:MAG: hypothetical protein K0Q79_979 [Flavipsychrobacter sp.]|jgi:hypothetical protein|nr:hypothetical protein [Flavipsychrobacter sp.]
MVKYTVFLCFLLKPFFVLSQEENYQIISKRIDSIIHAKKKYKRVVRKIAAIPDSLKYSAVMFYALLDEKGQPIKDNNGKDLVRDVCRKDIGYRKAGAPKGEINPGYLYFVYYSVKRNRIVHLGKKPNAQYFMNSN